MLFGIAIGDAFGAGVEFQDRDWIREHVDFTCFVNARANIPVEETERQAFTKNYRAWNYTDDTEMTIGLIKALICNKKITEDLLIQKWKEEYEKGKQEKGFGRNGHGSMAWYFAGEKSIAEIRAFQKNRPNPGNAPASRAVPLGLIDEQNINAYAAINANATHPNEQAVIASQCIARAAEFMLVKQGDAKDLFAYCRQNVALNQTYQHYLNQVDDLGKYEEADFEILCGTQPIVKPYFLAGIKGLPSDSMYTTGCALYILKHSKTAFDALKMSIYLGGDVDSIASITTGIMAGRMGLSSLPNFMLEKVENKAYLLEISNQFETAMQ